jgi:hypothetical protein
MIPKFNTAFEDTDIAGDLRTSGIPLFLSTEEKSANCSISFCSVLQIQHEQISINV